MSYNTSYVTYRQGILATTSFGGVSSSGRDFTILLLLFSQPRVQLLQGLDGIRRVGGGSTIQGEGVPMPPI